VRVKRWAVATIGAHLPETSAALMAGLLLGEKTGLPPEASEAFRRAGVYHILAVSGFNVALLATSVFFVLSTCGVPRGDSQHYHPPAARAPRPWAPSP
jgi:competence protein ComEC